MSIDRDTIKRLERLAGLTLAENERRAIARDLERIVEAFRAIQSVDVRNTPDSPGPAPVLRDDTPRAGAGGDEVLDRAPDRDGRSFRVPPPFQRGEE